MSTYERVRVVPDGASTGPSRSRPFTVILRDPVVSGPFLTGIEVDREGDEVAPKGVDERRHIIMVDLVTKRTPLVMDRLTATLVEPGDAMTEETR